MTTQKLLTIGLIALVITVLLAVGGALFKSQDAILSTSSVPSSTTEALSEGYEIINSITVPPEPDPVVNNATLAGVDVNTNGVRDDVERLIAQKFGNDTKRYTEAIAFSRYELSGMVNQNQETSDAYGKAIDCTILTADELDPITFAQINTPDRRKAYAQANAGASGGMRNDCEGWEEWESNSIAKSAQSETINGIAVPPEPDPAVNNATLAGVDSNNNGVRDDVERVLAKKAPNVGDFNDLIKYFAAYQRIATDPTPNNREAAVAQYRAIMCSLGNSVPITHLANLMRQNEIDTLALVFNTSERIAKRTATGKMLDGGYDGEELLCE